ncbi:MAG: ATP-binding protein [Planctomycetes bacterium]|nr:ATP-binding protein [Planctomycetota bacterium]
MNFRQLKKLVRTGESSRVEFKKSTGELRQGLQTLCAFLNSDGGTVLFGVSPRGELVGQQVADSTLREIAQAMEGFEPSLQPTVKRMAVGGGKDAIAISVQGQTGTVPFTFDGRAYTRVQSTTRRMPQETYEQLLLERAHSKRRWENQEAENTSIRDIDRSEVFRMIDFARAEPVVWVSRSPVTRAAFSIASAFAKTAGSFERRSSSSASASCPTFLSVSFGWRASEASTRQSSSIRRCSVLPRFVCSKRPRSSASGTSLYRVGSFPGAWSASIARSSRQMRCARSSSTRSSTATTRTPVVRWRSRSSTIASRCGASVGSRTESARGRSRARTFRCFGTLSSRRSSTDRG